MGYGSRALSQLKNYYEGKIPNLMETEDVTQQVVPSIDSQVSRNVQAVDEGARGSEFPKLLFVVILPRFKLDICLYPLVSASNL